MSEMERIKNIVSPIAEQYGIDRIALFGSRARGDAAESSDYDFLISRGEMASLLNYISFVRALETAFGCHVDVVSDTSSDMEFVEAISKEAIPLYER